MKYYLIIIVIIIIYLEYKNKTMSDNSKSKKIMSNSERLIAQYLDKLNVRYKVQYTFNKCKDKKRLPFDFAIIDKKGKVLMLIEYDGEQHSNPVVFNKEGYKKANKNLIICKKHDNIKNKFCKKHNIRLLRINYKQRNELHKIIKRTLIEEKII